MGCCAGDVLCVSYLSPQLWLHVDSVAVTNTWQTGYFPINSSKSFDNTASKYDPSAILTGLRFDEDKYNNYSRLYMPATLAIAYGMQFAALTAVFVHTFRASPISSPSPSVY